MSRYSNSSDRSTRSRGRSSSDDHTPMRDSDRGRFNRDGEMIETEYPPFSRLFMLYDRNVEEANIKQMFEEFGSVQDVYLMKDRNSHEFRGMGYIKMSKFSEAIKARDGLNGKQLGSKSVKLMIANSRNSDNSVDLSDEDNLLRLFILIPSGQDEESIRTAFTEFGDVTDVYIPRDKSSGERKSVGYVRFSKALDAAIALESCSSSYRAVLAEPKGIKDNRLRGGQRMDTDSPRSRGNRGPPLPPHGYQQDYRGNESYPSIPSAAYNLPTPPPVGPNNSSNFLRTMMGTDPVMSSNLSNLMSGCQLTALCQRTLNSDMVHRLFDIVPGLEYCRAKTDTSGAASAYQGFSIKYNNPMNAAYAMLKVNGIEYPPGHMIVVKSADISEIGTSPRSNGSGLMVDQYASVPAADWPAYSQNPDDLCSVKLPPPQPMADPNSTQQERLFLMFAGPLPSQRAIEDVFSRFGHLISISVLANKNVGFARYSERQSALNALETLHMSEVMGRRVKVVVADPPLDDHSRKRRHQSNDH